MPVLTIDGFISEISDSSTIIVLNDKHPTGFYPKDMIAIVFRHWEEQSNLLVSFNHFQTNPNESMERLIWLNEFSRICFFQEPVMQQKHLWNQHLLFIIYNNIITQIHFFFLIHLQLYPRFHFRSSYIISFHSSFNS